MPQELKGKIALITGASRGIGRAIALRLAKLGADIAVNYVRNTASANTAEEEISREGGRVGLYQANVGDPKAARQLVDSVINDFGGLDILVHNAAIGAFKPAHKLKLNQWDLSFDVNTKALLILTQSALPSMEKRGGGTIVALSSLGAQQYIPNYGAIGISKAALEALIRYLAAELAPKGIRVNGVSGGLVQTDALQFVQNREQMVAEVVQRTPAGRIGEPDDLARVVEFLVLPSSEWIVGQTLVADGGLSIT
ncbi:MAG: SDR family oxidoreductase [Candidatus Omnitrophota bacterium]|nr:SDR family oxidoreductase [Candidatus Omnitrophota bacterium]